MAAAPTGNAQDLQLSAGDAFDLLQNLSPASVDLIFTSPPYWGHRGYELGHNWEFFNDIPSVRRVGPVSPGYEWYRSRGGLLGLEPYPEWYISHLAEVLSRAADRLKTSGSLLVNVGDTYFARWSSIRESGRQGLADRGRRRRKTPLGGFRQEKQLLLIPARFAIEMQARGWILRNDIIWHKPNATPRPEGDRLKLSHEHFFHFVLRPRAGRAKYFFDSQMAERRGNDVIAVNASPGEDGHSATFPRGLIRPRILSCCPPGGVVLDPFCGTGRALDVALDCGMRVVGFDLQGQFVTCAARRLSDHERRQCLAQPAAHRATACPSTFR